MSVIDGIGVISGVLGIIGFFQSLIPGDQGPNGARVQVKAGLGDDNSSQLGGQIAAIYGFDYNNNYLGSSGSGSMGDGGVADLTIDQSEPGVQADYISVQNSNDAVCIAWLAVKNVDGADGSDGSWTGDVGYSCGQEWYYGNQVAGKIPDTNDDYRPHCAWLDADHTNGFKYASMKVHLRAYGESAVDTLNSGATCASTIYSADAGPINAQPARRAITKSPERRQWIKDRLIVSSIADHTAKHLCNHPNSKGPDFVGSDGFFCDMGLKKLTPLCSTEHVDGCVQIDAENMRITRNSSIARRSMSTDHRSYKKISHW